MKLMYPQGREVLSAIALRPSPRRYVYCPMCDGYPDVNVDGKSMPCPACNGSGKMRAERAEVVRKSLIESGVRRG